MTKPIINDLQTLNAVQSVVNDLFKNRVCELEQWGQDALEQEFYSLAGENKAAARHLDALRLCVFLTLSDLFTESLTAMRIEEAKTPLPPAELPDLPAKTRTLTVVPDIT